MLREISWLKHLSKDRCSRRKCEYGMYASLVMYSWVHQNVSKRDEYIGHVHGWTKKGIDKRQKAVVTYSAWLYAVSFSLAFSSCSHFSVKYFSRIYIYLRTVGINFQSICVVLKLYTILGFRVVTSFILDIFLYTNLKNWKSFCGKKDALDCAGIRA